MDAEEMQYNDINELVKEFLAFNGMESALECFRTEENSRTSKRGRAAPINAVPQHPSDVVSFPTLYQAWPVERHKEERENVIEKDHKELQRQHSSVLQSARQIFSIAINCLQ